MRSGFSSLSFSFKWRRANVTKEPENPNHLHTITFLRLSLPVYFFLVSSYCTLIIHATTTDYIVDSNNGIIQFEDSTESRRSLRHSLWQMLLSAESSDQ